MSQRTVTTGKALASLCGTISGVDGTYSREQRDELTRWAQSRSLPAGDVFRARLILVLADGMSLRRDQAASAHDSADHFAMETAV